MKKYIAILLAGLLLFPLFPRSAAAQEAEQEILLSFDGVSHSATLNGEKVPEYDYTWHLDPTADHGEVKNSPAEYHTGTAPSGKDAVYIAHDIIYSPELPRESFRRISYSGDPEWVSTYQIPGYEDYIVTTLPALGSEFPSYMLHSPQEAYQNAVLHITQPGTYRLKGTWQGQIWVEVGKKDAHKVTLILDGVDITCSVAPAVVFYKVCETGSPQGQAGANIILAEGSVNRVSGANVYRILKTSYKDREGFGQEQKKAWKIDGAIHSYQTLHIGGQGLLQLQSSYEGIVSEKHLTVSGGEVGILSRNDGINVSEEDESIFALLGGKLHIQAGLGEEGDGIDSNGTIEIHGGQLFTAGNPACDVGLDSRNGTSIYGGTVLSLGESMTSADSGEIWGASQPIFLLEFRDWESADRDILLDGSAGEVLAYRHAAEMSAGRSFSQLILSSPGMVLGGSYRLTLGAQRYTPGGKCTQSADLSLTKQLTSLENIAPVAHKYAFDGERTYTCSLCGHSYDATQPTQPPATTPQPQYTLPDVHTDTQQPESKPSGSGDTVLVIATVGVCIAILALCLRKKKRSE